MNMQVFSYLGENYFYQSVSSCQPMSQLLDNKQFTDSDCLLHLTDGTTTPGVVVP